MKLVNETLNRPLRRSSALISALRELRAWHERRRDERRLQAILTPLHRTITCTDQDFQARMDLLRTQQDTQTSGQPDQDETPYSNTVNGFRSLI